MDPGGYLAGTAFLLVAAGGAGFTAVETSRRCLPGAAGPVKAVAGALLGASALAVCVLLPGMLGILTRGTFAATAILLALLTALWAAGRGRSEGTPSVRPSEGAPSARPSEGAPSARPSEDPATARPARGRQRLPWRRLVFPAAAVLVFGTYLIGELLQLASKPPLAVDFISYDLPVIGRWIQSGSVWHITELFPLQTHGTYPQSADLFLAVFVLPFHNDALVSLVPVLALLVTGLACFCIARELAVASSTAILLAALFCAIPTVAWQVQAVPPDAVALAAFMAGLLFLVRHVRSRRASELALAGLGLGFAAGSLWYFSSAVLVLVVVWAATVLVPGGPAGSASWRHAAARSGLLVGTIAVVSGFWLVRNLVETGDPFYPVRIAVAGHTIFAAPPDLYRAVSGFSIADYLATPHVVRHFIVPALWKALGVSGLLLALGLAWVAFRSVRGLVRHERPARLPAALLLASVLLAVLYILTPYSAFGLRGDPALTWVNVRYLIPALGVAVAVLATAVAASGHRLRMAFELAACAATIQGVVEASRVIGTRPLFLAIGAAVSVLIATVGWLWWRPGGWREAQPRVWGAGSRAVVVAAGLAALLGLGYAIQRRVNATRYDAADPTFAWIQAHPRPLAVGLAGSFDFHGVSPAWPMFGERIQNRVAFVGPLQRGHLTQYRSRRLWLAAVQRGRYDVLEIATDRPPPYTSDNEPRWAAESGFSVLARSPRLELVRVPQG